MYTREGYVLGAIMSKVVEAVLRRLTKYEIARIVGARALQLSFGAPPLIDLSKLNMKKDPVIIALIELYEGVLPITICRVLPSGKRECKPVGELVPESREFIRRTLESWGIHS